MSMSIPHRYATHILSEAENAHLASTLRSLHYPAHGTDYEAFVATARERVTAALRPSLRRFIEAQRNAPNPSAAIVLRNLPTDPVLPATPLDGLRAADKAGSVSESLLTGIGALLGEPYAFEVEKGELVHDVTPVRSAATELSNRGSNTLGLHTELAAFEARPRWLLLVGLRADHARVARTPVADVRDALPLLSPEVVEVLRGARFRSRVPLIFDPMFGEAPHYSAPHSVLTGPDHSPELRAALYGGLTEGEGAAEQAALVALERALQQVTRPVLLEPGVMAILNNYQVVHGRSAYQPRYDGSDRWFQRLHVADSLWPLRQWQGKSRRLLTNR